MAVVPLALIGFDEVMTEGIKCILGRSHFRIKFQAPSLASLSDANGDVQVDGVLIDTRGTPDVTASDLAMLRNRRPDTKIVLIAPGSTCCDIVPIAREADGVILSSSATAALVKALELILIGQRVYPTDIFSARHSPAPIDSISYAPVHKPVNGTQIEASAGEARVPIHNLSEREVEVTNLLCNGAPNKVIARQLGISEATVKVHVKAILRKTHSRNRTEAALLMTSMMRNAPGPN